ncbi:MAG: hypothetical protein AVDCRST_MAG68-3023, partial [uncultured Gemmatimonadetes bacterium]
GVHDSRQARARHLSRGSPAGAWAGLRGGEPRDPGEDRTGDVRARSGDPRPQGSVLVPPSGDAAADRCGRGRPPRRTLHPDGDAGRRAGLSGRPEEL